MLRLYVSFSSCSRPPRASAEGRRFFKGFFWGKSGPDFDGVGYAFALGCYGQGKLVELLTAFNRDGGERHCKGKSFGVLIWVWGMQ